MASIGLMSSVDLTEIRLGSQLQRSLANGSSEGKLILRVLIQSKLITFLEIYLAYYTDLTRTVHDAHN